MGTIARAVWEAPRAPGAPTRVWRDWVLIGLLAGLALLEAALRAGLPWLWLSLAVELALIATVLWRRTHPGLMVAIALGAGVVMNLARLSLDPPPATLYTTVFVLILLYALLRWGSGREILLGVALVVAGIGVSFIGVELDLENVIGSVAVVTVAMTLGAVFRHRARLRAQSLEQARLHERESLARDLHDTVAHRVSAIAIRAQAGLATVDRDPAAAADALRVIERQAGEALAELRSLVRVLRDDDAAELAPAPGIAELRALTATGEPPVRLHIEGDVDTLPVTVANTLYRLVQESLTNARRHASGATVVEVDVVATPDATRLRVRDDGRAARTRGQAGFGIVGMAERVALLGGTFSAGPDASGGWTVDAELPGSGAPT